MAILMGELSEEVLGTNINAFTEQFGMSINVNSVVRAAPYKHLHPKEVFISQGLLNPEVRSRLYFHIDLTHFAGSIRAEKMANGTSYFR